MREKTRLKIYEWISVVKTNKDCKIKKKDFIVKIQGERSEDWKKKYFKSTKRTFEEENN